MAHLDKRIPIAAGLAVASADAAAAVDCALQAWGVGVSPRSYVAALELGADVPFFARNVDAALVTGRGEQVERLKRNADPGVLLVTPPIAMSTATVFARFDERAKPVRRRPQMPDFVYLAEQSASLRDANDLWPAALSLSQPSWAARRASSSASAIVAHVRQGLNVVRDLRMGRRRGYRSIDRGVRIWRPLAAR